MQYSIQAENDSTPNFVKIYFYLYNLISFKFGFIQIYKIYIVSLMQGILQILQVVFDD